MDDAKPLTTPVSDHPLLESLTLFDPTEYQRVIDGLQYLTLTRPDIAFTVNHLAKSMSHQTDHNQNSVKYIFRYLKGTLHHGLILCRPFDLSIMAQF